MTMCLLSFRVADGICYAHEEATTAVVQLIQMQLFNLYPKYRYVKTIFFRLPSEYQGIIVNILFS